MKKKKNKQNERVSIMSQVNWSLKYGNTILPLAITYVYYIYKYIYINIDIAFNRMQICWIATNKKINKELVCYSFERDLYKLDGILKGGKLLYRYIVYIYFCCNWTQVGVPFILSNAWSTFSRLSPRLVHIN